VVGGRTLENKTLPYHHKRQCLYTVAIIDRSGLECYGGGMKKAQEEPSSKPPKRRMGVLRRFSRLPGTLLGIKRALDDLVLVLGASLEAQQQLGSAIERLEALERSRAQFEAEMDGLVLKAEGKFRAANNAEARARTLKGSRERNSDPLAEDGEHEETEGRHAGGDDDAAPSEADRLLGVRMAVASTNKTLAQRAKFGVR